MSWGAVVAGGAALIGGAMSSRSSKKAAQQQAESADKASEIQKEMYEQTRKDLEPYRVAGGNALEQMMGKMAPDGFFNQVYGGQKIYDDPSYQFRLNQGLKAVEQGSASQGNLLSGATLKALNNYAQESASQEYHNAYNRFNADQTNQYNRLSNLIGMGQNAAAQMGNNGMQTAQAVAQNTMAGADAMASGRIAQNNAWANTLGQLGTIAGGYFENRNRGAI